MRAGLAVVAVSAALGLAACGGGAGGGGNEAVELTKLLPRDMPTYAAADLAMLREDLDLAEDEPPAFGDGTRPANPTFASLAAPAIGRLAEALERRTLDALDLGSASGVASASDRADFVTVIATTADTGVIGSALGDLGYRDRGGVLGRGAAALAFRLEEGRILASDDPAALRGLPGEPADDVPQPLLGELDQASILTRSASRAACLLAEAAGTNADGSGQVALSIDGGAQPDRLAISSGDGLNVEDVDAEGGLLVVTLTTTRSRAGAPADAMSRFRDPYDCG